MREGAVVVGAPVYRREWILPQWIQATKEALAKADCEVVRWVFIGPEGDPSWKVIRELLPWGAVQNVLTDEPLDRPDERVAWTSERYHHMARLRNHLLTWVRHLGPRYYLSLDTDILLHEKALLCGFDALKDYDAVGLKCYLGAGVASPNYANLVNDMGMARQDCDIVQRVDAIMAAKLMTFPAYSVDYRFHHQGEDVGWSIGCREAGVRLGWDGRVTSWHVRHPKELTAS